jgi:hypothetical protein
MHTLDHSETPVSKPMGFTEAKTTKPCKEYLNRNCQSGKRDIAYFYFCFLKSTF